jgi:hypothetical protein
MPLSVLRRAYSPAKLSVLYRLLDELSLEASGERSDPLTESQTRIRDRLARAIVMTVSSGEHDPERIRQTVRPIVLAARRNQSQLHSTDFVGSRSRASRIC